MCFFPTLTCELVILIHIVDIRMILYAALMTPCGSILELGKRVEVIFREFLAQAAMLLLSTVIVRWTGFRSLQTNPLEMCVQAVWQGWCQSVFSYCLRMICHYG